MTIMGEQLEAIQVLNIDHLGIVAGIIDEMGLVEEVNRIVGTTPQEKISPGLIMKAMILNGRGFFECAIIFIWTVLRLVKPQNI